MTLRTNTIIDIAATPRTKENRMFSRISHRTSCFRELFRDAEIEASNGLAAIIQISREQIASARVRVCVRCACVLP
ncbi:hypothetical protein RR46_15023 [Papilio xuthus]|uniref:Uncharacterized protein n=1 Tax=Papilio xuthus TaxID=66420 RepID=A0A194PFP3_PAPXU|nr:hypothetical protein RR46_15023 [Papilio xuthus]